MTKFKDLIRSPESVLVDFFADWCGPCKTMAPNLSEVKIKLGDKVRIFKIYVDKNQATAAEYEVRSISTLILFKNGKEKWRHSGVIGTEQLCQIIDQFN